MIDDDDGLLKRVEDRNRVGPELRRNADVDRDERVRRLDKTAFVVGEFGDFTNLMILVEKREARGDVVAVDRQDVFTELFKRAFERQTAAERVPVGANVTAHDDVLRLRDNFDKGRPVDATPALRRLRA